MGGEARVRIPIDDEVGRTTVKSRSLTPEWNEDISFSTAGGMLHADDVLLSGSSVHSHDAEMRGFGMRSLHEDIAIVVGKHRGVMMQGEAIVVSGEHSASRVASGGNVALRSAWNEYVEMGGSGASPVVIQDGTRISGGTVGSDDRLTGMNVRSAHSVAIRSGRGAGRAPSRLSSLGNDIFDDRK